MSQTHQDDGETGDAGEMTLNLAELAGLIEESLGQRPAASALRAALVRPETGLRGGLLVGLPRPVPSGGVSSSSRVIRFSREDVREWLATHPRHQRAAARDALVTTLTRPGGDRVVAIGRARDAGLFWSDVAAALALADDRPYTRQAAQQWYARATRDPGHNPQR